MRRNYTIDFSDSSENAGNAVNFFNNSRSLSHCIQVKHLPAGLETSKGFPFNCGENSRIKPDDITVRKKILSKIHFATTTNSFVLY